MGLSNHARAFHFAFVVVGDAVLAAHGVVGRVALAWSVVRAARALRGLTHAAETIHNM